VTEHEAYYFMHQICNLLDYLHRNHIVYRDLKLGNLLLNNELQVKLGVFGLAARISKTGERKMSVVSPFLDIFFKILYNF
jgi:polo-like kinase 1